MPRTQPSPTLYGLGIRLFFGLGGGPRPLEYYHDISFCLVLILSLTDRTFRLRLEPPRIGLAIFRISKTEETLPRYFFSHIIFSPCLCFGFSHCYLYTLGLLSHHSLILSLSLCLVPGVLLNNRRRVD